MNGKDITLKAFFLWVKLNRKTQCYIHDLSSPYTQETCASTAIALNTTDSPETRFKRIKKVSKDALAMLKTLKIGLMGLLPEKKQIKKKKTKI